MINRDRDDQGHQEPRESSKPHDEEPAKPRPSEAEPPETANTQSGEVSPDPSPAEMHWSQMALGLTTLATAVLGAALLAAGLNEGLDEPKDIWDITRVVYASFAIATYIAVLFNLARVMSPGEGPTQQQRTAKRRTSTMNLLASFIGVAAATVLVIMTTAAQVTTNFYQELQERTTPTRDQKQS